MTGLDGKKEAFSLKPGIPSFVLMTNVGSG